ncbi:saccharopine dehydrogenase family protein [Massilia glaciei]|uniref:Saccharopine dehydrogenase n=1 Tax=Massilia glaciei TaxID=1524097 RepID=A0A2U2HK86_9BURK|nr:saccharopine dehydrogenase NADP-binding domain-containing protein [Massilia glaciei]PWF47928.1 saccharopine dehydrogenase [Massilia glaciei]
MNIVVIGAYGNFGARLCRALARRADMRLIVAGRDLGQARQFAGQLGGDAQALRLDVAQADLAQALRDAGAQLVIHTAGPFAPGDYAVALAAAAAGAHYVDLADNRRFVCDFSAATDAAFRRAGRLAITGASTVPALSSAVVDHLTEGWRGVASIDCCIAPAQSAPRGLATLASVLSYCGAPIKVWQDGAWVVRYGWADRAPVAFRRLRPRAGALCDIPDLELFPARYPGVRTVMFRAALEVGLGQAAFALLATLRRKGLIARPERFAKLMHVAGRGADFLGTRLGGMVVRVRGVDAAGAPAARAWHIAADNDHGPEIPAMAAILLARRLAGGWGATGSHSCMGQLALAEFEPEFAKWGMLTDIVEGNEAVGGNAP